MTSGRLLRDIPKKTAGRTGKTGQQTMRAVILSLAASTVLAGCSGGSGDSAEIYDQYARMRADLGTETSATYLNTLNGDFVYTGTGFATFDNAGAFVDAVYDARVTAEFGPGQDYVSGDLTNFVPFGNEGNIDDTSSYEGNIQLQRVAFLGNDPSGTMDGQLRYIEVDAEGVETTNELRGISGNYNMQFHDSSSGIPAEYIETGISGGVGGGGTIDGNFIVQNQDN
ncbi:MAG: hypothetical protein JKP98_20475 [Rhodobacteraceae bacterium]|nr:hypothetical protein [Paracoccaceae bacterium]MBL4558584.1 hypothetical protein [Paracoccaceae bacterium]